MGVIDILKNYPFTYTSLVIVSLIYILILHLWRRHFPESFEDNDWLIVTIWSFYTFVVLAPIVPLEAWLKSVTGFFASAIPVVIYALVIKALRRRKIMSHINGGSHAKTK